MEIYGLKTCDTCRKAAKALPEAQLVDIRNDPLPETLRAKALDRFGAALVNRRSTTWRGLSEEQRARPAETLLALHPALMKRPLIVAGDAMYLGWDGETRAALLGAEAADT